MTPVCSTVASVDDATELVGQREPTPAEPEPSVRVLGLLAVFPSHEFSHSATLPLRSKMPG
jgi:hypothetical protein